MTELISDQNVLMLGNTAAWDTDDPWLDRINDKFAVQFTASDSEFISVTNLVSGTFAGQPALLLSHSFTVTAWIHPDVVTGIQTIL